MVDNKQKIIIYERINDMLSRREAEGKLRALDISWAEQLGLHNSDDPDLQHLGRLIHGLVPNPPPIEHFSKTPNAAESYVRLEMARLEDETGSPSLPDELLAYPRFKEAYEALTLNVADDASEATGKNTMVILHGTWAKESNWWHRGGDFWQYINNLVPPGTTLYGGIDHSWSGHNSHNARINGAKHLARWVSKRKDISNLDVIAHSHGGNVALYAAAECGLSINKLILLGTPIRMEYLPSFNRIGQLYNVFSTGDMVQRPGTFPYKRGDGRTMSDGPRSLNVRATHNGDKIFTNPGHSDLHAPETWKRSRLDKLVKT